MPEVYRESRTYTRDRSSSPSDDEYRKTTVRRYKVTPTRVERVEREFDVIDEDRRGRYGRSSQGELLEVDRRIYAPDRPRSAFEPSVRDRDDRYTRVEYRDDGDREDRSRTLVLEHKHHDDDHYDKDTRTRVVYESKEVDHADAYSPRSPRDYDRRSYWDDKETDVRIEKRIERRDDGAEVRIERRVEERRDEDVERWRKETEYYEPVPAPIVIRPRPTEQKIIVQEAPAPVPVFIREKPEPRELALARHPSRDEDYYYHRESREVGPWRSEHREEEIAIEHFDDHRHHHHHRRHHHHHHHSDGDSGDEYYYKKKTVIRDRSSSSSPHRKRHIAEGALAGAGLSAILASRRNENGELPEKRGRKVLAGAALGALGTEVVRRAHSAFEERYGDDQKERSRSRSRERPHSRIKTGLGIAAVALAAAGAAKYYQSNKVEKEEMGRGRPLRRYSDDESSRSRSRKRSKSRASSIAKAAAGTAAVVGLARHYQNKRSKSRDGKSRSRSRLRTGAEIVAAGLAGAGAKKLYDRHKDKKQERSRSARSGSSDSDYDRDDRRRRSRSRSLSRSGPTHPDADYSTADPELGMVEYGAHPLYTEPRYSEYGAGGAVVDYESAAEESRSRRRKKHRHRSRSIGDNNHSADSEADSGRDKKANKKRSRSRLRDIATGAAAMGAAAIGIKKYNDKKEKDREKEDRDRNGVKKDRDQDREREKDRSRSRDRDRERNREWERRRYEDESSTVDDYTSGYGHRNQSPAHASGGYYNPPAPGPIPPGQSSGFTQHPNTATTNLAQTYYQAPYDTPHYPGYQPPPPDAPPNSEPNPGGVPPPIHPNDPEHVSEASRVGRSTPEPEVAERPRNDLKKDGVSTGRSASLPSLSLVTTNLRGPEPSEVPQTAKSVTFIPLSPRSSKTLQRHREEQEAAKSAKKDAPLDDDDDDPTPRGKGKGKEGDDGEDYIGSLVQALIPRSRPSDKDSVDSGSEEEVIEVLPERFDSQGRPLDRARRVGGSNIHTRRGEFEYRSPRGPGGLHMQGQWGVAGTDPEAVERIVRNVTGVLEGRGSWLGLLGNILGGGLLQGIGRQEAIDEGERIRRDRREKRGTGSSRRRRSMGDYDRDDVDDDYFYDDGRRRKRMTRGGRRREWDDEE